MIEKMNNQNPGLLLLIYFLYVWSLAWKGVALWRASKSEQRNWFIALLVLNTAGILDLVYLFKFARKKLTIEEIRSWPSLIRKPSK